MKLLNLHSGELYNRGHRWLNNQNKHIEQK